MHKELTYQIVKQNSENSAQGTTVANNETELTESNPQRTNVPNSLTELKEKTAQSTNVTNNLR